MNLFWGFKENNSGTPFSKKMTGVWQLVNETALLLNRTAIKDRCERQLGVLRSKLQQAPANPIILEEVSAGLTELRRQIRLAGYDLSMGKYALIFDGFRHDDSIAQGFKRMALFIGRDEFFCKTGDENHLALAGFLNRQLNGSPKRPAILEMHYLWYKKTKTTLSLSGAATETAEDYESLKRAGEADSLLFLSRLKGLF
jgi:hypothetical protein